MPLVISNYMNESILEFIVPGEPVGKARPRVTKFGAYTPAKTVNYETLVKEMFAIKYPRHKPYEGQIAMGIEAFFQIPQSRPQKVKKMMAEGDIKPCKKPDCDNILKIVADALNNMAYEDDKQIITARVSKHYTDANPRVEITIVERGS
jgi:Holliday junction resolvase RusA-like endonuclease